MPLVRLGSKRAGRPICCARAYRFPPRVAPLTFLGPPRRNARFVTGLRLPRAAAARICGLLRRRVGADFDRGRAGCFVFLTAPLRRAACVDRLGDVRSTFRESGALPVRRPAGIARDGARPAAVLRVPRGLAVGAPRPRAESSRFGLRSSCPAVALPFGALRSSRDFGRSRGVRSSGRSSTSSGPGSGAGKLPSPLLCSRRAFSVR